jgi:hypothetical protein
MTRKDYVLIAQTLAQFTGDSGDVIDRDKMTLALAKVLQADNPRFDRDRFLVAAGYVTANTPAHIRQWAGEVN